MPKQIDIEDVPVVIDIDTSEFNVTEIEEQDELDLSDYKHTGFDNE